jgi:hypothetical protein
MTNDERLASPDESDPTVRFDRYIVEPTVLAYAGIDHWTDEQVEAAKATGWLVMTRAELLSQWWRRTGFAAH